MSAALASISSIPAEEDERSMELSPEAEAQLLRVRANFLEGLAIPTAVLAMVDGELQVQAANTGFAALGKTLPEALQGSPFDRLGGPMPQLLGEATAFFAGQLDVRELRWHEQDTVAARHYIVRFARLGTVKAGEPRALFTLVDRTAEIATARSMRAEMLQDSLTGLPNMVGFGEEIDAAIAEGGRFAILTLDLRRFSRINESLGGVAGDELLITVARRLMSALRAGDILARTGGDEFGVFMRVRDACDAERAAVRLRALFEHPIRLAELEIRAECVIGIALSGGEGHCEAEELIRNAQFAAKQAKGAAGVQIYQADEAQLARRRFSMETALRRAIESNELSLAFQPVIDLATGRLVSFEALSRWRHAELGQVAPSEFIPVAEEAGLIVRLGRWALDEALRTLADWDRKAGHAVPVSMAVNVSTVQLREDDVPGAVADALARNAICGERLTLELTESVVVHDPERASRVLRALKEQKLRIALDDFGTGYSSFAYLQRLPIDILKIDRSFVTGMLGDRDSVAIVRAVLGLADALGMATTAEGVETRELAQTLGALGCRLGQGFHFGPPLSSEEAYALLPCATA
jgi:diguanylate cyclase (GGDEF)-like protein